MGDVSIATDKQRQLGRQPAAIRSAGGGPDSAHQSASNKLLDSQERKTESTNESRPCQQVTPPPFHPDLPHEKECLQSSDSGMMSATRILWVNQRLTGVNLTFRAYVFIVRPYSRKRCFGLQAKVVERARWGSTVRCRRWRVTFQVV